MERSKHEGLGFYGKSENSITMKTIFIKEKDMSELDCSSGQGETLVTEGVSSPPPHPFLDSGFLIVIEINPWRMMSTLRD
jgi:hypothetical protein